MTIQEVIKKYPQIETELLLQHVLKKPKEFVFLHGNYNLTIKQFNDLSRLIKRRLKGEPIAYILGYKDFYGLRFKVDRNALVPRPETEQMVEAVVSGIKYKVLGKAPLKVIDVGTGSGCIIVSIGKQLRTADCELHASDVSKKALSVAKLNAKRHKVKVTFHHSNLLSSITEDFDIIVANLPYGWSEWKNNSSMETVGLKYEPKIALFTKNHGLYLIDTLLQQIAKRKHQPKLVYLEFDPRQKQELSKLIRTHLPQSKSVFHKDFHGLWRFVEVTLMVRGNCI